MNWLYVLLLALYLSPPHFAFGSILLWSALLAFTAWYWKWASGGGMGLRRKIQIATWKPAETGTIICKMSFDATKMLGWVEKKRQETNTKITLTHAIGKSIALAIHNTPGLNGYIFMGRYIPFENVNLSFLTTIEGGKNLFHAKIDQCERKKVVDIAQTLIKKSDDLRASKDPDFQKSMEPAKLLPTWLLEVALEVGGWLASSLGLDLAPLGLKKFPFGSCLVTSIGSLGIHEGWAPFTPFARTPLLVAIGALKKGVVVGPNNELLVREKIKIMATIDHRFLDGAQGQNITRTMNECFENPDLLDADPK